MPPQYLSTDPNFGASQPQYLSTDPNFGGAQSDPDWTPQAAIARSQQQAQAVGTAPARAAAQDPAYIMAHGGPKDPNDAVLSTGTLPQRIHRAATNTFENVAPVAAPMAVAAPLATGLALVGSTVGGAAGYGGAKVLAPNADPAWADVAGDVGAGIGGVAGNFVGGGAPNLMSRILRDPETNKITITPKAILDRLVPQREGAYPKPSIPQKAYGEMQTDLAKRMAKQPAPKPDITAGGTTTGQPTGVAPGAMMQQPSPVQFNQPVPPPQPPPVEGTLTSRMATGGPTGAAPSQTPTTSTGTPVRFGPPPEAPKPSIVTGGTGTGAPTGVAPRAIMPQPQNVEFNRPPQVEAPPPKPQITQGGVATGAPTGVAPRTGTETGAASTSGQPIQFNLTRRMGGGGAREAIEPPTRTIGAQNPERELQALMHKNIWTPEDYARARQLGGDQAIKVSPEKGIVGSRASVTGTAKAARGRLPERMRRLQQ